MPDAGVPDVSVIVAVHNLEDFVGEAVQSALAQQGVDVDVIVVDDASTDRSPARVRALDDPRVTLLVLDENRGVAAARNRGLALARAPWVQFLDADDLLAPGKLAAQLDAAGDLDVIAGGWIEQRDGGGRATRLQPEFDFAAPAFAQILSGNPFPIHALLVRRELALAVGGFDAAVFHEDWDFWLKIAARGARFGHVPGATVVYRIRGQSRSSDLCQRLHNDLAYLDSLPRPGVPADAAAIARSCRRCHLQLALHAALRSDREDRRHWQDLCEPLGLAERVELFLAARPMTAHLAGRIPGPRKLRRLVGGWLRSGLR